MKALHDTQITHENNLGRSLTWAAVQGLGPLLKSAGATIYGVDISHEMLRVAKTADVTTNFPKMTFIRTGKAAEAFF